ncbi:SRPBCC family protein [Catellatospora sichuanensis]|uniref:SRPBCC family protein n=1 Tax=Catellatospora sichuanensis TaxID=1969805 RepID=UPI001182BFD6|nr:SRPBCC family protein [Catellatospora sichuanensis]
MAAITTTIQVERPAADVFSYVTDPTRFHEWQQGVVGGHMDTAAEPTVGTRCVTTRRIGGKNRSSVSTVTRIDPTKRWAVQGIDGPIRATVDLTVQPITAGSSQLTISVDFTGHGIGKILVPLMVRPEARKAMPNNLAALKRNLEEH